MNKKIQKFLSKDNFVVALLEDADGTKKAYFGKRAKHEEVKRLSIAYCVDGKEGYKLIYRHAKDNERFVLAFNEKGKVVLFDGETCVTGGFKNGESQFLILIETDRVVVLLVFDSKDMLCPSIMFAEEEAQRDSYIRLYFKLQKLGFCKMKFDFEKTEPETLGISVNEKKEVENDVEKEDKKALDQ